MTLLSVVSFTAGMPDPRNLVDSSKFHPRVLVATSSCVGASLDSSYTHSVIRVGFAAITLDLM